MAQGAPEWKYKSNSFYLKIKRRSEQKEMCTFFKLLYLGKTSALPLKMEMADHQC